MSGVEGGGNTISMCTVDALGRGTCISLSVITTPEFEITRASLVSYRLV